MTEMAERGAFGARKLVLGFDAGCMTCSELARKIDEEVGDKLEVRPLHHPQVAHWREQALGENTAWAPTLIEVKGGEVKAWTGLKMALVLSQRLGPGTTWRVMQLVGEVKSAPKAAAASAIGLSRGKFIKNMGGAALGVGVLSATGGLASPALAQDDLNEEDLAEAFSVIEQIPDSVMAQGDEAAREWLRANKLQEQPGTYYAQGVFSCSREIVGAIISNVIPVGKIRAAIRAFGGSIKLARFIIRSYRRSRRRFGYGPARAARITARKVANRTFRNTGQKVFDAVSTLFSLNGVRRECF